MRSFYPQCPPPRGLALVLLLVWLCAGWTAAEAAPRPEPNLRMSVEQLPRDPEAADAPSARTRPATWGLGLMLGDVSGINAKYWLGADEAVDFGLGEKVNANVCGYAGYLYHVRPFQDEARTPLHIGGGAVIGSAGTASNLLFGARGNFGVDLRFEIPVEIYFEITPTLYLAPRFEFGVGLTLGGRVYFL